MISFFRNFGFSLKERLLFLEMIQAILYHISLNHHILICTNLTILLFCEVNVLLADRKLET